MRLYKKIKRLIKNILGKKLFINEIQTERHGGFKMLRSYLFELIKVRCQNIWHRREEVLIWKVIHHHLAWAFLDSLKGGYSVSLVNWYFFFTNWWQWLYTYCLFIDFMWSFCRKQSHGYISFSFRAKNDDNATDTPEVSDRKKKRI